MNFKLSKQSNEVPSEYVGQVCEILYFSDCFKYCEVLFPDGNQFFVCLKSLSTQGV